MCSTLDFGVEGVRLRVRDPELKEPFLSVREAPYEVLVAQFRLARIMREKRKLAAEYAALVAAHPRRQ